MDELGKQGSGQEFPRQEMHQEFLKALLCCALIGRSHHPVTLNPFSKGGSEAQEGVMKLPVIIERT
jgi:hypothetical protein